MNLPDYLKTIGEPAAVALFGVSKYTVRSWRYGWRKPSPTMAQRIIDRTNGKVGWGGIYNTGQRQGSR